MDGAILAGPQVLGVLTAEAALAVVPGPNTALILAQSAAGGRGEGLATVAGVQAGMLAYAVAPAFGLSALLAGSPRAFEIARYLGAAYLVSIALRALSERGAAAAPAATAASLLRAFRRALLGNLANPSVAFFCLAFLPQFVRPERGHVALQVLAIGLIASSVGVAWGSLLVLGAVRARGWLASDRASRWLRRLEAGVFLALGLRLALTRG